MLSERFGVAGRAARVPRGFELRRRGGLPGVARPARLFVLGLAFVLAVAAAVAFSQGGPLVGPADARPPLADAAVTYAGVRYQLAGVEVTRTIPQPGGSPITASGTFEIVRLRLQAHDRRTHSISSDLLALDAGGTYYGVSSPDVLGLTDRRWGPLAPTTAVPAVGPILVRAVFDVPPGVPQRRVSLHIGQFDYVDQAPAQTLDLPACCGAASPPASREHAIVGPLSPDPLLG